MCEYLETTQRQHQKPQPVRQFKKSDHYRGGAEAEIQNCHLNFGFNANISKNDSLMSAVRESIKGMHPDNICGQPLHGPNDNWALTIETYGSIAEKSKNTYAFSATPELIIGGPARLKISELPNTVQEAYDNLKTIDKTGQVDFGTDFSRQIIEKIKKDRSKRKDATTTILSLPLPMPAGSSSNEAILTELNAFAKQAPPATEQECTAKRRAISHLLQNLTAHQRKISNDRKSELSKRQAEYKDPKAAYKFRSSFNKETARILSSWEHLSQFLAMQDTAIANFSRQLTEAAESNPDKLELSFPTSYMASEESTQKNLSDILEAAPVGTSKTPDSTQPNIEDTSGSPDSTQMDVEDTSESVTESDIQAFTAPLSASFTKSLNQITDKEMMAQITLGIPLHMFGAASKALVNEDTPPTNSGILDEANYHSKSSNFPDITKEALIDKMRQKHLSYESNALFGLLHIINAYRRGLNNTNPQKGPKHEMVLVNKNPLPDVIKSLDEPENFEKWIALCAELIADDFIENGNKIVSWTGGSFTVSDWKNTLINQHIDLMAVYEKAYRHGQVGGLPQLNTATPYDPVGVYEFRHMPNRTLPMLKTIFEKLVFNIDNFH